LFFLETVAVESIGLHGQTMVDHGFQKPVYETCGPGSSLPIGKFGFWSNHGFFNHCSPMVESQTLPVLCGNQKIFQTDKKLEK
jgi:hypothetical protein